MTDFLPVPDELMPIDFYALILRYGIALPALLYFIFFRVIMKLDRHGGDNSLQRRSRDMPAKDHDLQ